MTKSLASYGLIFTLLVASLQVPVFLHTCHLFDITDSSVYTVKKCCDPSIGTDTAIAMNCCSLELKNYKADLTTELTRLLVTSFHPLLTTVLPDLALAVPHGTVNEVLEIRPPPRQLSNTTLLHFIQVLRI